MIDEAPVTGISDNDALDSVRAAVLARVPWLVAFLDERRGAERYGHGNWPGQKAYERIRAASDAAWAQCDRRLATCTEAEQRAAIVCLLPATGVDSSEVFRARELVETLLPLLDGWTSDEVAVLLRQTCAASGGPWAAQDLGLALQAADRLDTDGCRAVAPWLRHALVRTRDFGAPERRPGGLVPRLRALLGRVEEAAIPEGLIPAHDAWAAPLRERTARTPGPEFAAFVGHLTGLTGPRPTQRWSQACPRLIDAAAARELVAEVLRGLAEEEPLCSRRHGARSEQIGTGFHHHYLVHESDGDLARGLVWAAALTPGPTTVAHLTGLALRVGLPARGLFEDLKLAGAAINALAAIDDPAALEALWRLQARIRHRALRKQLDTALVTAAARQGITAAQLVERSVPDHGLAPDGWIERALGTGHRARVAIEDGTTVRLTFTTPDGRTSRTAPAIVKDQCASELTELKTLAKELRGTLSGERARVEALLSADRSWPYDEWSRHYRDHPVTGSLTRGLIWEFADPDGAWHAVAPGTEPPVRPTRVRLWHPIHAAPQEIRSWREHLVTQQLRQPFKQAFREVYLLTPAEAETGGYSNRFAAHIVHYQRLYALFKERGWQANYLSPHDGGYDGQARAEFGDGEWRAWFHHEPVDVQFTYSPDHARTDQVRFDRRTGRRWQPVALTEVPPAVFSEAMRDIDLFVAVTSIAADPTWTDRGDERHAAYWQSAGFGALTASSEIRREALERIVPRLRIAKKCTLDGRYLVVRGELATYRIHLGSANILMEPSGAYLCIVPSRGPGTGKVFLPFEDERLSLILSKAFLLADDTRITDASILAQIRRGA